MSSTAVTDAVDDEIESYRGVDSAACEDRAAAAARQVLDDPELATRIEITASARHLRSTR